MHSGYIIRRSPSAWPGAPFEVGHVMSYYEASLRFSYIAPGNKMCFDILPFPTPKTTKETDHVGPYHRSDHCRRNR